MDTLPPTYIFPLSHSFSTSFNLICLHFNVVLLFNTLFSLLRFYQQLTQSISCMIPLLDRSLPPFTAPFMQFSCFPPFYCPFLLLSPNWPHFFIFFFFLSSLSPSHSGHLYPLFLFFSPVTLFLSRALSTNCTSLPLLLFPLICVFLILVFSYRLFPPYQTSSHFLCARVAFSFTCPLHLKIGK